MSRKLKRFLSSFLALMMVFSIINYTPRQVQAASTSSASDYGLMDNVGDGVILHAWNWSFTNIKNSMKDIAEAGYTAVQTSPVQRPKEYSQSSDYGGWWKVYQPTSLSFSPGGHPWFGSKDDFKAMCDEAEKYGVKVIVDVVANHMANNTGSIGNSRADISSQNEETYRDDDSCWHLNGSTGIDYGNVYRGNSTSSLTRGFGGWPDLNTGSSKVQQGVLSLLKECIDLGADGFRFDAAKHIELPTDPDGSDFWPVVINGAKSYAASKGVEIYCYGEILDDPGTAVSNYTKYMGVTDNRAGNNTRNAVNSQNAAGAANSYVYYSGEKAENIVLWAESHDTYANDNFTGESVGVSQANINKTWAIVASRDFPALYYIRPSNTKAQMGEASGNTSWKNKEVAEVNKFHNYFSGTSEYMGYDGSIVYDVRNKSGVVLVNVSGNSQSVNFSISKTGMADGTYTDQVTGNQFTVSGGTISGQIGNTGIAVVYNAQPVVKTPKATISQAGGNFASDTLTLTLGLSNATSGTYKIGSASAQTFTGTKTITIGSDMSYNDSVTITLTATDGSQTSTDTYTFTKVEKVSNIAYLSLPSGWSTPVYCYVYDEVLEGVENAAWPGVQMTKDSSGYYKYEVPDTITTPRVIFYSSASNRYPADMEDGLALSGSYLYKDGSWTKYSGGGGTVDPIVLPDVPDGYKRIFFKNTAGWSTINAYSWISGTNTSNAAWPGKAMSVCDASEGIYYIDINTSGGYNSIIFNNGSEQTDDITIPTSDNNMYTYSSGSWSTYSVSTSNGKVTVNYVDESGKSIATSVTLTGKVGEAYTTTAATVSGYTLKTTPSNATGKYTAAAITVTYVYSVSSGTEPTVTSSLATGSSFKTETQTITLTLQNAASGTYSVDDGPTKTFTGSTSVVLGQGKVADSTVTVKATAKASNGTTKSYTFTYNKVFNGTVNEETNTVQSSVQLYNASGSELDSQYQTNPNGAGIKKTITVDGDISDWDSSMIIAQGAANDDPRVYRDNSMYEKPIDLYTLYGCYDDNNLYLMWEMTNVQDIVAPNDNYPITQGVLYQTENLPFFIAIDTGDSSTAVGNNCKMADGGYLWNSGISFTGNVNKIIAISTNGSNGPFIYGGTSAGLTEKEEYGPTTSGIAFKYGLGILSTKVMGINGAYGSYNGRVVGDMTKGATYVDFNAMGHNTSEMDFHYEMSIPLEKLGTSASQVASNGLGVLVVATFGASGMDCLPYDTAMNDNADLPDTESQEFNSFEKSDEDEITAAFARIGKSGGVIPNPVKSLELNFGADRSAPQVAGTALTLSGIAQGGTAPYTYKYYVNNTLVGTKSGSGETSVAWTPSAGSYTIKCVVTDSAGNTATSVKKYTVEGSSTIKEGWKKDSKGWWYQNADGTYPKNTWKQINGKWYHFDANGYMQTGWYKEGSTYYYLKSDGSMAKDEWVENDKYYLDANGKWVQGKTKVTEGWKHDSKGWWYQNADGTYPKNTWKKINGKWYHFDASGYMQTGWYKEGSTYYYLKSDGSMAKDEWVENDKYYLDANGKWVQGKTKVTAGWKHDSKGWWYQNADGTYPKNTWKLISGQWYHFDASGYMQTGWYKEGSYYYYLKSDGSMAVAEWVENGKYYVDSKGHWVQGKTK